MLRLGFHSKNDRLDEGLRSFLILVQCPAHFLAHYGRDHVWLELCEPEVEISLPEVAYFDG